MDRRSFLALFGALISAPKAISKPTNPFAWGVRAIPRVTPVVGYKFVQFKREGDRVWLRCEETGEERQMMASELQRIRENSRMAIPPVFA